MGAHSETPCPLSRGGGAPARGPLLAARLPTCPGHPVPPPPASPQHPNGWAPGFRARLHVCPLICPPSTPAHSPHSLDMLPGRGARQRPLLLLGAPVHGQQLEHSNARALTCSWPHTPGRPQGEPPRFGISFPRRAKQRQPCIQLAQRLPASPGSRLVGCRPELPCPTDPPRMRSREAQPRSRASLGQKWQHPRAQLQTCEGRPGQHQPDLKAGGRWGEVSWDSSTLLRPHPWSPRF